MRAPRLVAAAMLAAVAASGGTVDPASGDAARAPRLLSTGQTVGYIGDAGAIGDGNRDDGDLVRGRLQEFLASSPATPTIQLENTVLDANTGLQWIADIGLLDAEDGLGAHGNQVLAGTLSWQAAVDAANGLLYAGHDDWRLPNVNELETIVDFGRAEPALDPLAFPGAGATISPYLWSSTTLPSDPRLAYYVNTRDGHAYPFGKPTVLMARPVRTSGVQDPVAILATGQSTAYRGDDGGLGTGNRDDGDLRHGLAVRYAWTQDGDIDEPAENVVLDENTQLAWLRDPALVDGQGGAGGNVDLSSPATWQSAVTHCNELAYADRDDWRLPNIRELWSIMQVGRGGSVLDPEAFPGGLAPGGGAGALWWSSTTSALGGSEEFPGGDAWFVATDPAPHRQHARSGGLPSKALEGRARCVCDATPDARDARYLEEVRSSADFLSLTLATSRADVEREGKYLVAAAADAPPPRAAYQDVNLQPLHYEFLRDTFPEDFGALSAQDYVDLVARRSTRRFYAGSLRSFVTGDGQRAYGFDAYTADGEPEELLTLAETGALYRALSRTFRRRPLVYCPTSPDAMARAEKWLDAPFVVAYPAPPAPTDYEAYTTGLAYGTVRTLSLADLPGAVADGAISWQDLLVLDRAPTDVEAVVAGLVTGSRQGPLSHLAVRSARRGTPNLYLRDAHAAFGPLVGRLVRLAVGVDGYSVTADVPRIEAEAWWRLQRPDPVSVPVVDVDYDALPTLGEIGRDDSEGRATRRVGGKAANLARLYVFLPERHQVPGLAVPFRSYDRFMRDNLVTDRTSADGVRRPLADYVAVLAADERVRTDPAWRAMLLADLRARIQKDCTVEPSLASELAHRIVAVFGPATMVRFRSSSNAEDDLRFGGAGLYDSTSVCAEDTLDGDDLGPSRCDGGQAKERTVERGLAAVWSSLWNARAWDERAHYGIDQELVAMAVLVTTAFPDERANGVAFTGNPVTPEADEYLVNAQAGDASVVLPDPGVLPERDLLTMSEGRVTAIRRVQSSSLVPSGQHVLSDDELRELGAVMAASRERFPIDLQGADPADVMLDFEFKVRRSDDALLLKQVRPFLAREADAALPPAALIVDVPAGLALCAMWRSSLPIRSECEDKAVLQLPAGLVIAPLDVPESTHDLLGDLRVGPDGVPAMPTGPTTVTVAPAGEAGGLRVTFRRAYRAGGRELQAKIEIYGVPVGATSVRRLDEDRLTSGGVMVSLEAGGQPEATQLFGPCGLSVLPRERLEVDLEGGQSVSLEVRKGRGQISYQWAELVSATAALAQGSRTVGDYAHLVYDASRHNWNEEYWVLFDPPLDDAGGLAVTQTGTAPGRGAYSAALLDTELRPMRQLGVWAVRVGRDGDTARAWLPVVATGRTGASWSGCEMAGAR